MKRLLPLLTVVGLLVSASPVPATTTGELIEVSAESQSIGRMKPKPGSKFFVLDLHPKESRTWSEHLVQRIRELLVSKGYVLSTQSQAEFFVGYAWGSTRQPDRSVEHVFHVAAVRPKFVRDGRFDTKLLNPAERSVGDGVFWVGEARLLDPTPNAALLDEATPEVVGTLCKGAMQRFGREKSEWSRLYYVPDAGGVSVPGH